MNGRTNSAGGALVSDMEIPLDPCTDFVGVRIKDLEYLGKVRLTWTDPKDKYATPEGEAMEDTDQLVSKWSYTQIVRQADRAPVNPSDGVTVCTETTRNQYQLTGFVDTTAESNVTYYYGAYAFNEDGVYSEVISNGVQPVSFSTTLADNTWEEIDQACTLGLAESLWEIGDIKILNYPYDFPGMTEWPMNTAIVDFNHDDLSDGSGKASITFSIIEPYVNTVKYGHITYAQYLYGYSDMKTTCESIFQSSADDFKPYVKSVIKQSSYIYGDQYRTNWRVSRNGTSIDNFFPLSITEVGLYLESNDGQGAAYPTYETEPLDLKDGYLYPYFSTNASRDISTGFNDWWLRNTGGYANISYDEAYSVYKDSDQHQAFAGPLDNYDQLVFGFCIGKVAV